MNTIERASRTSGRRLYREIWKTVDKLFYDGDRLKEADWAGKKNLYDARIVDDQSALACAQEALACLDDSYTRLVSEPQFLQHVQEREDMEESAVFSRILPGNIGYIRIMSFSQSNIFQQVTAEVEKLKECDGFIVDVRDNGGGLLNETANCCEYFVAEGLISGFIHRTARGLYERASALNNRAFVVIEEKNGKQRKPKLFMRRPAFLAGKPTVVLINEHTASSAELFASSVIVNGKEKGNCIAIGQKTAGKGIAQTTVTILDGKARLKISHGKFLDANFNWLGDCGQRVRNGVTPEQFVDDTQDVNAPLAAAYAHLKQGLGSAQAAPAATSAGVSVQ